MAGSTYQTLLQIAFEIENAPDLEAARAAIGRLIGEAKQADQAGAAFKELGLDIVQLRTGMSASEQSIVKALRTIAANAETTGTELRTSIVAALQQIHSPAGLQALENELQQLAVQGRLTAQEMRGFSTASMDLTQRAGGSAASLQQMSAATTETGGAVGGLMTALKGLGFGYLAQQAAQMADSLTLIQDGFEAVFKSSEVAKQELDFVRAISNRLGIDLISTANAFLSLAAAAQGTNLKTQQIQEIFTAVSGAMAVLGKSSADTEGALLSLEQMISKGVVQSEELRQQLGERLPGAYQVAAKAMGVSTAELSKMLEQGKVLADDLLPKLAVELEKTYGGGAKQVETFAASFNRLWNSIKDLTAVTAESGVGGFFQSIVDGSAKAVTALETVPIAFNGIGTAAGNMAGAVASGTSVLGALGDAGKQTGTAIENMLAKMLGVPTAAQFAAEMNQKFAESLETVRTPLEKLQEAVKGNLQLLPADLKAIVEKLRATGDAATAAEAAFKKFADAPAKLTGDQGVLQLAQTIQLVEQNARGAETAVREGLAKELDKLTTVQLVALQKEAQSAMESLASDANARQAIMGLGEIIDTVAVLAFKRLGIDGKEAMTGISDKAKESIEALDLLGQSTITNAAAIRQAFSNVIDQANTIQELDAIQEKLRIFGEQGKLSANDITYSMTQIQQKAAEVRESLDPTVQALNRLGIDGQEALTGVDNKFQDLIITLQAVATDSKVTGDALFAAVNKVQEAATTRDELDLLKTALQQLGEQGKLSGEQVKAALMDIEVRAANLKDNTDLVTQAFADLGIKSQASLQAIADEAKNAFGIIKNSGASINEINAAFEAMAVKVLAAGQAAGPMGLAMAEAFLRSKAATAEEIKALDELIKKIAETQATSDNLSKTDRDLSTAREENVVQIKQQIKAQTDLEESVRSVQQSFELLIPGYNELTDANKKWIESLQIVGEVTRGASENVRVMNESVSSQIQSELDFADAVARASEQMKEGVPISQGLLEQLDLLTVTGGEFGKVLTTAGQQAVDSLKQLRDEAQKATESLEDMISRQKKELGDARSYEEYQHKKRLEEIDELSKKSEDASNLAREAIENENRLYEEKLKKLVEINAEQEKAVPIVSMSLQGIADVDLSKIDTGLSNVISKLIEIKKDADSARDALERMNDSGNNNG